MKTHVADLLVGKPVLLQLVDQSCLVDIEFKKQFLVRGKKTLRNVQASKVQQGCILFVTCQCLLCDAQ